MSEDESRIDKFTLMEMSSIALTAVLSGVRTVPTNLSDDDEYGKSALASPMILKTPVWLATGLESLMYFPGLFPMRIAATHPYITFCTYAGAIMAHATNMQARRARSYLRASSTYAVGN